MIVFICKIYDILLGRIRPNPVEFDRILVEFDGGSFRSNQMKTTQASLGSAVMTFEAVSDTSASAFLVVPELAASMWCPTDARERPVVSVRQEVRAS